MLPVLCLPGCFARMVVQQKDFLLKRLSKQSEGSEGNTLSTLGAPGFQEVPTVSIWHVSIKQQRKRLSFWVSSSTKVPRFAPGFRGHRPSSPPRPTCRRWRCAAPGQRRSSRPLGRKGVICARVIGFRGQAVFFTRVKFRFRGISSKAAWSSVHVITKKGCFACSTPQKPEVCSSWIEITKVCSAIALFTNTTCFQQ